VAARDASIRGRMASDCYMPLNRAA
jgi:hypothetical protein